ncbi:MAG: pyruvate ferredoxin oxidoreductase [Patescibacteria group bacterium]|nr:pyruvate ferredoxin oxidoreductase [Patescibacteria group bacterium]MBU1870839.1 pyruvate ferredoxin oxidoreductase [Patescibacteria group bacterium]
MKSFSHQQILEGSRAIALTIKNIAPAVISAYPITPQTHIVEDLAKFKADDQANYEYVRAESEFAAASIIVGASATGVRVYSATSSQGLLLMTEVIYNIAGMRLPIVMTCANRAVSAPINIWCDQQDVMTIRDAGWILLFAENHQEAVNQHVVAFKIAEQLKLPVMVNVDGFILTHTYEPVIIPDSNIIKKYLPDYKPTIGQYLDPKNPATLGLLATPAHYMKIRQKLHNDLMASLKTIDQEYKNFQKIFHNKLKIKKSIDNGLIDNGLIEYTGPNNPDIILVAMGSVVGTIKDVVNNLVSDNKRKDNAPPDKVRQERIGILKIKCFRPFPAEQILKILKSAKHIAVLDKSISLGHIGCLASDIKAVCQDKIQTKIQNFIIGLGGRDVTGNMIKKIIREVKKGNDKTKFIEK